ncbi:MAG TPA: class I SAM-dependent methyltransferase [Propionibacteriaceae bacterium]
MSEGTSGVDSTATPAAGGQPVWDEDRVRLWLATADARERQLHPLSDALFDRASLQPGERVLDVGVGSGPTTGQAWEAVRPDGSVTGIDIAPPMIAAARQRVIAPEIEWIVGDAASYDFPPRTYDAVISRLGVMFFTDPVAGFHNLCEATRPGGRLIVTVWSNLYATGLFGIPYTVATTTLHRLGVEYQGFPPDGILFSLGRSETIREVLNAAGWTDVETAVDNRLVHLPPDPLAAAKMTMMSGPVGALLEGQPEMVRAEVEAALAADYTHRQNESGIGLPSGFIVVAARRP